MPDRATRPLNDSATKKADDDLYARHAGDPRPNALYAADGSRKPLDPDDPDQAGVRQEWMASYKANGGETEPSDYSGAPVDQVVLPCGQKVSVDPVIVGTALDYDETEMEDDESGEDEPEDDDDDSAADPEEWKPTPDEEPDDE
jgi:hypothetical protein